MQLDKNYWTQRYQTDSTGWDAGKITTPLKEYIDQLNDKQISVLIPGVGNAWEAEYLFNSGFTNVTIIDISEEPLGNLQKRIPEFPSENLICADFFEHSGQYDLIIEQTFFCALDPALRNKYAQKMNELLKAGGKLVGLLFSEQMKNEGPPFGGTKQEYTAYFSPYFEFSIFESCYNSIPPRSGRELFINLKKKW